MFYYPNVLQRHRGRFATIWLAATGGTKLVKREYLKVNVAQTCQEILAFVLVQVPPPVPGAPRPRFSLYLSAQLQYGVVCVYSRQCHYLIEIQQTLERLHRSQQQIRIDMVDLEQPGLLLPDNLAAMEALEDAPEPFFGVMEPPLPSPRCIPQIRHLLEAPTPERPLPQPPSSPLTVSPEAITLREPEPITLLEIEGEQDLPEVTARELALLAQLEDEALLPPPLPPEPPKEPEGLPQPSSPTRLSPELPAPVPLEMSPKLEPHLLPPASPPAPRPRPPPSPELELEAYELPRRARRQLLFDTETQIPRHELQRQLLDPQVHCQPLVLLKAPGLRRQSPAELLNAPTYGWMPPELQELWQRCAHLQQVDYAGLREAEEPRAEPPSELEVLREVLEPSLPPAVSSEISLETTEEEPARPSLLPPEERRLPTEAEAVLPVVPEVSELTLELPPDKEALTLATLHRWVGAELERMTYVDFAALVPAGASRAIASRVFSLCLDLCRLQLVHLEQAQPYGPIMLYPGARFQPR
ncbi:meiotic recombination REC8-like protein isoform A [Alligator mississippiensis]|uniref:Meiotic recombination REC8-like protein isoform A n=1 Tax=Alligator mississippiensis TaxID=8496 RepID=A0A151NLY0_ALLMI|nr:meiotic recombination REC8-like protein isoform A [Alligator mississippiensis]